MASKLLDIQNSRLNNCAHSMRQAIQVETNAGRHDIYPTTINAYLRLRSTNMPNPCLHVHLKESACKEQVGDSRLQLHFWESAGQGSVCCQNKKQKQNKQHTPYAGIILVRSKGTFSACTCLSTWTELQKQRDRRASTPGDGLLSV